MGQVAKELEKKRFDICSKCINLTDNNICLMCGCHMTLKVQKDNFSCPENKW